MVLVLKVEENIECSAPRGVDVLLRLPVSLRPHESARLGILPEHMPDLACLVGNDWIEPDTWVHRCDTGT